MSVRSNVTILALAAMALPAAFAQSTSVFVGGETGWIDRPVPSTVTRAQVRAEFLKFRANPVSSDGGRYVGGEQGYAFPAHMYAMRNGQWVCIDKIAHNPKPDAIRSPREQRLFQQTYPA